jgi:hypothetical protein
MPPVKGKTYVALGSLLMIASPITCVSATSDTGNTVGGCLFIVGLLLFVVGRLKQE